MIFLNNGASGGQNLRSLQKVNLTLKDMTEGLLLLNNREFPMMFMTREKGA